MPNVTLTGFVSSITYSAVARTAISRIVALQITLSAVITVHPSGTSTAVPACAAVIIRFILCTVLLSRSVSTSGLTPRTSPHARKQSIFPLIFLYAMFVMFLYFYTGCVHTHRMYTPHPYSLQMYNKIARLYTGRIKKMIFL